VSPRFAFGGAPLSKPPTMSRTGFSCCKRSSGSPRLDAFPSFAGPLSRPLTRSKTGFNCFKRSSGSPRFVAGAALAVGIETVLDGLATTA
jgi:hypothetical protein